MRLTGGSLRSRRLPVPGAGVRPTPGRVREALFSILAPRLAEARLLDLYAGTGAIGFEALSRGARHATFVERDPRHAAALAAAARAFGIADRCAVRCESVEAASGRVLGPFDLVYADPPYDDPVPVAVFERLLQRATLGPDALLVYEHRARAAAFEAPAFTTVRKARYGEVALQFLRCYAAA